MTKNAFFYFIDVVNDYTLIQYKYLSKTGQDIFVFIPDGVEFNENLLDSPAGICKYDKGISKYPSEDLAQFTLHKLGIMRSEWAKNSERFNGYENVYLVEPVFRCSQDITELITMLDEDKSDLLSTYIQKLKGTNVAWGWYNVFKKLYNDDNYPQVLKSYDGGFTRLSFNAFKFLMETTDPVVDYFIDLSLPTLLYNNGFTIASYSESENDPEFQKYTLCNNRTYYYSVGHILSKDYNTSTQLIYNAYKKADELFDLIDHKIENPDFTVILPIYNEENNIDRCLESILNQEDFTNYEVWCINDGSTDRSREVLAKYKTHPNVVVIERDHKGLINTLNFGVEHANGKYIMRMDCDDIMLPNRMKDQFRFMEEHPEADILGSSVFVGNNTEPLIMGDYEITLEALRDCNRLFHPAVVMRTSSIRKLPYLYEYYFEAAEDYKLWATCAIHGLRLFSNNDVVLRYSPSRTAANPKQAESAKRIQQMIGQIIDGITPDSSKQLTAIVTFRNEYDEIERTVAAIRGTTKNMPIILLNDASDNDYDYEFVAKKYHCQYLYNPVASGVAGGRNDAVKNVRTKFFIILDGHMRMYEQDWDMRALDIIREHGENNAYFGKTGIISKHSKNDYTNEAGTNVGATYGACLQGEQFTLTPKWICEPSEKNFNKEDNVIPVPILLGADYIMSVEMWNKIHGLEGLLSWGQDETLLSLKVWLAGAKVLLIQDMIFGHVYRDKRPYNAIAIEMNSNYIYCNYLFARDEKEYADLNYMYEHYLGHDWFMKAYNCFMERYDEAKAFKEYFYNEVVPEGCTQTMDWFWEFNYNADPKQVQDYYDKRDAILAERDANNN